MGINEILLIVAALLPAIILLIYVYKKDRVEKEPPFLLLLLFLAGIIIIIPCIFFETIYGAIIDIIFNVTEENPDAFSENPVIFRIYSALSMFFSVALVEEFFKWISMVLITKRSKHFNSLFDGIVYSVFVSLGFAALENVFYVIENGWGNAVMRAVLSVPGHMFFAVFMGYFYSMWHINDKAALFEEKFRELGVIDYSSPRFNSNIYKILSLTVPVLIHGFYNYCCSVGDTFEILILLVFVIFLYIFCFRKIKSMSKDDSRDTVYALCLIHKKYPQVVEWANNNSEIYNAIVLGNL